MKKQNKKYRAVVIGCGRIGAEAFRYHKKIQPATHAGAYQDHPRIELVGLVDIDPKKLKIAGKYFPNASLFTSTEKMFRKVKPDIVSITVPDDFHSPLVKLTAKFKTRAIVCEKPIAPSVKEAKEMIRACKKSKSLLFINHHRRFGTLIKEWREKVKKGKIGRVVSGNCYYFNGLFNGGTHTIDLLMFFLGKINWVSASFNKKTSWKKNDPDVNAFLGFRNGGLVAMQSLPRNYVFANFYFYGSTGRLSIKNLGYEIEHQRLIKNKYYKDYYQLTSPKIHKEKKTFMASMVDHVINCLDGKEKPVSRGKDGLAALEILLALKKSAENNSKIVKIKC